MGEQCDSRIKALFGVFDISKKMIKSKMWEMKKSCVVVGIFGSLAVMMVWTRYSELHVHTPMPPLIPVVYRFNNEEIANVNEDIEVKKPSHETFNPEIFNID